MGKLTISMAIFNSYVKLPEGIMNMNGIGKNMGFLDLSGQPNEFFFFFFYWSFMTVQDSFTIGFTTWC